MIIFEFVGLTTQAQFVGCGLQVGIREYGVQKSMELDQDWDPATLCCFNFARFTNSIWSTQPALRSSFLEISSGSSSHSNESVRAVFSIGSTSGMSSATGAPNSANLRAETSTRLSRDPTAWL